MYTPNLMRRWRRIQHNWTKILLAPPESLTAFASAVGWALRALQAEKAAYEEIEQTIREARAGLEGLSEEQNSQWVTIAWYLLLLVTHRRSAEETPRLVELIREEARGSKFHVREEWQAMEMTYAELLREQGRQEGKEEGRQEGRQEGAQGGLRAALEEMLTARFGEISDAVRSAIAAADLDTLTDWIRIGATANTLEEVGILSAQENS